MGRLPAATGRYAVSCARTETTLVATFDRTTERGVDARCFSRV
ncbi:MAG TPA: hypothetical protein VEK86_10680 [Gemmatimonadales bacterium]|nr:hypothetical protein [Gemmatimonadales bacterium]